VKVNVRRSVKGRTEMDVSISGENGLSSSLVGSLRPPIVRKSKLVVVDLAGSERIDKSGESSFLIGIHVTHVLICQLYVHVMVSCSLQPYNMAT
jgi:hypothetical protein